MTKLEAVNEILESNNEFPVTALDTGGVSTAAQAEVILDRENRRIQQEEFLVNDERDVEHTPADVTKLSMVIADAAWTVATRTLTKATAFTSYTWASGDQIFVSAGTDVTVGWYEIASRTSANAIVLKTSPAAADQTDVDTTLIGWDGAIQFASDILFADSDAGSAFRDVVVRNDLLYDRDNNTFTFSGTIQLRLRRELDFTHLGGIMAAYVVAVSSLKFYFKVGSSGSERLRQLQVDLGMATLAVHKDDQDAAGANITDGRHGASIRGESIVTPRVR